MLEKEIEEAGIPAVLIKTPMPTAEILHANRIVQSVTNTNTLENPDLSFEREKVLHRKIVTSALEA